MGEERSELFDEEVVFDSAVVSLNVVKRASYRFIDKFSVDIRLEGSDIVCRIYLSRQIGSGTRALIDDLRKEVLDQDLRETISHETEAFRNTILSIAFSAGEFKGLE